MHGPQRNWLSGAAGPSGAHLIDLMRSSDEVFEAVMKLAGREHRLNGFRPAGREQALVGHALAEAQDKVRLILRLLEESALSET